MRFHAFTLVLLIGLFLFSLMYYFEMSNGLLPPHKFQQQRSSHGLPLRKFKKQPTIHSDTVLEALKEAFADAADLIAAGGVHIINTSALLASANALPHFSLSCGVSPLWHEENNMYQLEENFEVYLRASPFVSRSAETAALYFVPQHALHDVHWCSGHIPKAHFSGTCVPPPRITHKLK